MTRPMCLEPLSLENLVAYHLGELPQAHEADVELHFFACPTCTRRLEAIAGLRQGVIEAVRQGRVRASLTDDFVRRITRAGLRVRTYVVAPGERVPCTAAPNDDFVVLRLAVEADDSEALDLTIEGRFHETGTHVTFDLPDVVRDPSAGQLVLLFPGDVIRSHPRSTWDYRIRVRSPTGVRTVGPYVTDHTPWDELPPA